MKRTEYLIGPEGWPCTLHSCPPGPFVFQESLCFKTEYVTDNASEAYCESGEVFWGGTTTQDEREKLIVQPVVMVKRESEL